MVENLVCPSKTRSTPPSPILSFFICLCDLYIPPLGRLLLLFLCMLKAREGKEVGLSMPLLGVWTNKEELEWEEGLSAKTQVVSQ